MESRCLGGKGVEVDYMSLSREISWDLGLLAWKFHFPEWILGGRILASRTGMEGRCDGGGKDKRRHISNKYLRA